MYVNRNWCGFKIPSKSNVIVFNTHDKFVFVIFVCKFVQNSRMQNYPKSFCSIQSFINLRCTFYVYVVNNGRKLNYKIASSLKRRLHSKPGLSGGGVAKRWNLTRPSSRCSSSWKSARLRWTPPPGWRRCTQCRASWSNFRVFY
jgi:hypothetical protein